MGLTDGFLIQFNMLYAAGRNAESWQWGSDESVVPPFQLVLEEGSITRRLVQGCHRAVTQGKRVATRLRQLLRHKPSQHRQQI